jgi:hypothetical protein
LGVIAYSSRSVLIVALSKDSIDSVLVHHVPANFEGMPYMHFLNYNYLQESASSKEYLLPERK